MHRPLIVGNWKMNTTLADATVLATQIKNAASDLDVDIVLCPPFVWLVSLAEILETAPANLKLGAQNMWFAEKGAMTGEISPLMIKPFTKFVILGHSERRSHFNESSALINDKIQAAFEHNLTPVVCVGELKKMHEDKRGRGRPAKVEIKSDIVWQLKGALEGISREKAAKMIIAYEPVWAIGTGNAATGAYANLVVGRLRQAILDKYGQSVASDVRILYGGSVTAENVREFIAQPEIDGVLAGGASLKAKEFIKICQEAGGGE